VNASDAISNVDISTYSKKLKNLSSITTTLANTSYFIHSLSIMPEFKATSWLLYLQRQSNNSSIYKTNGTTMTTSQFLTLSRNYACPFLTG